MSARLRAGAASALLAFACATTGTAAAAPTGKQRPAGMPATTGLSLRSFATTFAAERTIVAVRRSSAAEELLRLAGADPLSRRLGLWLVEGPAVASVAPRLERLGALRYLQRDGARMRPNVARAAPAEPLAEQQWWIPHVGAERVSPPGPGIPLVVLDDGIDAMHPEFAGRPGTGFLNAQRIAREDEHGTMVASVAAAPVNGVGIAGLYPQAELRSWDLGAGSCADVVRGVERAVRALRRAVLNFSGGFPRAADCYPLYDAVLGAVGSGHLVVAAAGNAFAAGSPESFPGAYPHVLTVAATDERDRPAEFSSQGRGIDLAAPGESIPVAVPTARQPSGFASADGTSFSAPFVSAAAAWAWTVREAGIRDVTQLFELVRASARDVGPRGWDADTGFGILDLPRLLSAPVPAADHSEPNDDVDQVRTNGLFARATPALLAPGRRAVSARASVDSAEDPVDVYRVWVAAGRRVAIDVRTSSNVDLEVFASRARTVHYASRRAAARGGLLGGSYRSGSAAERFVVPSPGRHGAYVYVCVYKPRGAAVLDASYRIALRASR